MIAGTLEIQLLANLARLQDDMGKAKSMVGGTMKNIEGMVSSAKSMLGSLGIGLSIGYFADLIKGSIDALDHLNDLSKSTGITVENLSGLSLLAKQTGTDLDGLAKGINKISVEIGKSPEKFKALGITTKDNVKAFSQLADIFNQLPDINQRNALAQAIFSKSWAELAPALSEGSKSIQDIIEKGQKLSGVTKENAVRADEFNDRISELKVSFGGFITNGIGPLLPMLIDMAKYMQDVGDEAKNSVTGFGAMQTILQTILVLGANVSFVFKAIGENIYGNVAALSALVHGDLKGAKAIVDMFRADIAKSRTELDEFEKRIMNPPPASTSGTPSSPSIADPKSAANAARLAQAFIDADKIKSDAAAAAKKAAADAESAAKKAIENNLKNIEYGIDREKDLLASRNKMIDLYNSQNYMSIDAYYKAKEVIQQANLSSSIALYDQEIAVLNARNAKKITSTERTENQGKINDLLNKEIKLQQDVREASVSSSVEKIKVMRDYQDSIVEVNAKILELTGHLQEAALINFDIQNRGLKERFTAEGNNEALKSLTTLRDYTAAQAEANNITEQAGLIQNALGNSESRIELSRKLGAISEIDALLATDSARTKSAQSLKKMADDYDALAKASGNPKLIQDADNFRLKLEELEAASHGFADKFKSIFSDSFSNAFTDFINGTKSASDAFRSFALDVIKQLEHIAVQKLATSIFSSMDSGGVGGWLATAFGGARALGGPVDSSKSYMVGERGPERFVPNSAGTIIPNSRNSGGGDNITISVNVNESGGGDVKSNQAFGAQLGNAIKITVQQELLKQKRQGGLLSA